MSAHFSPVNPISAVCTTKHVDGMSHFRFFCVIDARLICASSQQKSFDIREILSFTHFAFAPSASATVWLESIAKIIGMSNLNN